MSDGAYFFCCDAAGSEFGTGSTGLSGLGVGFGSGGGIFSAGGVFVVYTGGSVTAGVAYGTADGVGTV